jgi:hypothetical protein
MRGPVMTIQNRHGSILPLLLGLIAVVITIGIGSLTMVRDSFRSVSFLESKINEANVMGFLETHLKNKSGCEENFSTQVFDAKGTLVRSSLVDHANNKVIAVGDLVGDRTLRVVDIKLNSPTAVWQNYLNARSSIPASGYLLESNLSVTFERVKDAVGAKSFTSVLQVPVRLDGAARITGCEALAVPDVSEVCQQVGGSYDKTANACGFSQNCTENDPLKLDSGACVTAGFNRVETILSKAREGVAAAAPKPTAAPSPTDSGTTSAVPPTDAQKAAWSKYGSHIQNCILQGSGTFSVSADHMICSSGFGAFGMDLSPSEIHVSMGFISGATFTDPSVSQYIYNQALAIYQGMIHN